jgi:mannose-6-phosphate isomerase-like protein (cupin superfamily)
MPGASTDLDIEALAQENSAFRREIATGENSQIVVMSLRGGEEIGSEVHEDRDQVLVFIAGEGEADLAERTTRVGPGRLVLVAAGTRHNIRNTGSTDLKLYTIYAPPEHEPGTVHATKAEADAAEHH